ncbi:MAG: phenylalanine--tRNA ligase subunit alpha [Acholeplasmatales bacterium]|jgi:phenylalanyl-tRNA synthetase alpha chain|nr:phenylalanine--tRNA ligase subunit alpha [Acholeplasmatales bacterium]MDD7395051.1 phenylalanine--tRNA ligase subunit alpha [Acholeplasmatales bacterium]MDY4015965.1 phenylalanine--tRNA ligase subunit alpha [Bacilli bacterium]CDD21788.1 phenylalanine--tRNA ligase alpha subunit [Firmicutes bacterium CAG:313]HCX08348.1 phenylalanine--tRNA ligase subunit alpha [Acholeplasmatales bacterium]
MQLDEIKKEAIVKIEAATTMQELNELRAYYMGKKSPLAEIMKTLASATIEEKKTIGAASNKVKQEIELAIANKRVAIENAEINAQLEKEAIDVTMDGYQFKNGSMHPLNKVIEELEDIFISMGYSIAEGPEVEVDVFNFEMLNVPKGHPARDMQDSFYINENVLVRTQTSPVQVRTLLEAAGKPVKIVCPGKVYRRDDDDATHSHQFMQFEGLVVDKNITMSDLKGTLSLLMKKMFGENRSIRFKPSYFPFTEPSVEVDVSCFKCGGKGCPMCKHTGWIEVLGAGMVHPNVLKGAGYDPEVYRGFAFGVGIERVTMLRHNIDDIRNFYTNDYRFLKQFEGER